MFREALGEEWIRDGVAGPKAVWTNGKTRSSVAGRSREAGHCVSSSRRSQVGCVPVHHASSTAVAVQHHIPNCRYPRNVRLLSRVCVDTHLTGPTASQRRVFRTIEESSGPCFRRASLRWIATSCGSRFPARLKSGCNDLRSLPSGRPHPPESSLTGRGSAFD